MLDNALNMHMRVAQFDKKFVASPIYNLRVGASVLDRLKDSYFGHVICTYPLSDKFRHSVVCVARDASRLAHQVKIESLSFFWSRSVQKGNDLYVFFDGRPVEAKLISNLPYDSIVSNLPSMTNKEYLKWFAISCIADSIIILTGGRNRDGVA